MGYTLVRSAKVEPLGVCEWYMFLTTCACDVCFELHVHMNDMCFKLHVHMNDMFLTTCIITFIAHYSIHKKENQIEEAKK